MKKIYVSPETECVNVQLENAMLNATSLGSVDPNGGDVNIFDEELDKGIKADSRRGSIWDDEDY